MLTTFSDNSSMWVYFNVPEARYLTEAIQLYEQARDGQVKLLGATHPNTLMTLNNLAGAYTLAGRHSDAIPLYEQVAMPK